MKMQRATIFPIGVACESHLAQAATATLTLTAGRERPCCAAGVATMGDALAFGRDTALQRLIETLPREDANAAFDKIVNSTMHFRSVLTMR
jgi:D-arabinose 1-dehydrogenase-like Zn-dependent alcohol dehydrogenase